MNDIKIPPEIIEFFEGSVGRSLMIKGKAGTGKTILSFSLMEALGNIENSFYLSTRVSNESLYSQFDWLKEKEWRENLVDASVDFLKLLSGEDFVEEIGKKRSEKVEKVEVARKMLKKMRKGGDEWEETAPDHVNRNMLSSLGEKNGLVEIREIYNKVDKRLPEQSLIIIDSLESILERYEIDATTLLKTLQKDLVEGSGVNMIVVLEKEKSTKWDYLVDGYVTLQEDEVDGKRTRQVYLDKLRGIKISRPAYLNTLNKGRFRYFEPFRKDMPYVSTKKMPIEDGEDTEYHGKNSYSTGSPEFDELLDIGFPKDSFVLLEIGENVPFTGEINLLGPLMVNFLLQDRGVVDIPLTGRESDIMRSWLEELLGDKLGNNLTIFRPETYWTLSEEIRFKNYRKRMKEMYKEAAYQSGEPILTICEWENIEDSLSYLADDMDKESAGKRVLDIMRENSGLTVGILRPGLEISQKLKNISDIHLKMFSKYNTLLFTGEKPNLGLYNIRLKSGEEHQPEFIPLV